MYYRFEYARDANEFIAEHENAKLVGWPYGLMDVPYVVFIPKELPKRG